MGKQRKKYTEEQITQILKEAEVMCARKIVQSCKG